MRIAFRASQIGLGAAAALMASATLSPAGAGSAPTTLGVSMAITAGCTVTSSPVAFGSTSVLSSALTASGSLTVTCTNTTTYTVALGPGSGSGASVTNRLMTGSGSATVSYALYRDSGYTQNWGQTAGTDTGSGTGSGSTQTLMVYAKVASQTSPAPDSYADTVSVTVSF
jgi:spore coat protein U-like protein